MLLYFIEEVIWRQHIGFSFHTSRVQESWRFMAITATTLNKALWWDNRWAATTVFSFAFNFDFTQPCIPTSAARMCAYEHVSVRVRVVADQCRRACTPTPTPCLVPFFRRRSLFLSPRYAFVLPHPIVKQVVMQGTCARCLYECFDSPLLTPRIGKRRRTLLWFVAVFFILWTAIFISKRTVIWSIVGNASCAWKSYIPPLIEMTTSLLLISAYTYFTWCRTAAQPRLNIWGTKYGERGSTSL